MGRFWRKVTYLLKGLLILMFVFFVAITLFIYIFLSQLKRTAKVEESVNLLQANAFSIKKDTLKYDSSLADRNLQVTLDQNNKLSETTLSLRDLFLADPELLIQIESQIQFLSFAADTAEEINAIIDSQNVPHMCQLICKETQFKMSVQQIDENTLNDINNFFIVNQNRAFDDVGFRFILSGMDRISVLYPTYARNFFKKYPSLSHLTSLEKVQFAAELQLITGRLALDRSAISNSARISAHLNGYLKLREQCGSSNQQSAIDECYQILN